VHAARAADLQGSQQTQFMNMLKMKEYADESRAKNELKKWLSGKTAQDLDQESTLNELATKFGPQGLALAKQIDDRRKAQGEAEYRQAQITDLKSQGTKRIYDLNKSQNEDAIKTISGFTRRQDAIDMLYQSEASGTLSREAAENIRRAIPDNEEEFPAFKQNLIERLMSADERVRQSNRQQDRAAPKWELKKVGAKDMWVDTNPYSETVGQMKPGAEALVDTSPKPEKIEQNGKISFVDINPNSPTYGQPTGALQPIVSTEPKWTARDIGGKIVYVDENQNSGTFGQQKTEAELTKTAAPAAITESDVARLMRERASIEAQNPNDPRLKTYDAAIAKATATNQPLSDLARKQNELAMLEEELKADPNNKGLQQRIKEYKDDIRKDTQWKPTTTLNVAAPVTPVTIVDPNDPSKTIVVDGRTGKVIGQGIKEPSGVQLSAKEKQTREAKYPQATTAIKTYESKSEQLAKDLEKLANHPGLNGISGAIYGRLPSGTKDSMAAQALYDSIVARGGFKELQDMRAASPTGGALGNVSNQEGQYLRDAFAPISRTQSKEDLAAALTNAASAVRDSKTRLREAYEMTYEYRGAGEAAPNAPAARSDVRSKADAILGK